MEIEINVYTLAVLLMIFGFMVGLGIAMFNLLERKLKKKNYKPKGLK